LTGPPDGNTSVTTAVVTQSIHRKITFELLIKVLALAAKRVVTEGRPRQYNRPGAVGRDEAPVATRCITALPPGTQAAALLGAGRWSWD
jgi:hypothetical protein